MPNFKLIDFIEIYTATFIWTWFTGMLSDFNNMWNESFQTYKLGFEEAE